MERKRITEADYNDDDDYDYFGYQTADEENKEDFERLNKFFSFTKVALSVATNNQYTN